jgi:hypothetical protein
MKRKITKPQEGMTIFRQKEVSSDSRKRIKVVNFVMSKDDKRGLWVEGLLVMKNGEVANATFRYPSESNKKPFGRTSFSLKIHDAFKENISEPTCSYSIKPSLEPEVVIEVLSYNTSYDASVITLMIPKSSCLPKNTSNSENCNTATGKSWVDFKGKIWMYNKRTFSFSNEQSIGVKYQFIPRAMCCDQVKRDLM